MTSYRASDSHWPDPTRQTAQQTTDKTKKSDRRWANLPAVEMYINAVYYPNYRASPNQSPASLPLDTISHIFYAFAAVRADGTVYLSNLVADVQMAIDGTQGAVRACANLKQQRPYLKLVLSVGGGDGNKQDFASAASDPNKRSTFAYSARQLVDQYNFDGIDVDWEYPEPGQQASDYIQLLAALRTYLPAPRYLVSTALPAGEWCLNRFDLGQMASTIDLLNLMGYDFCGNWGNPIISGHHAALNAPYGGGSSAPAVEYLTTHGFPANKILLGCPAYGWSFLNCNNINQSTAMCGNQPSGSFDFAQLPRPGTQEITDETCVAAYCIGGDGGFVSYDSPQSIQIKAKWAKRVGLAGMFFWHALSDAQETRSLVYNSYMALHS